MKPIIDKKASGEMELKYLLKEDHTSNKDWSENVKLYASDDGDSITLEITTESNNLYKAENRQQVFPYKLGIEEFIQMFISKTKVNDTESCTLKEEICQ